MITSTSNIESLRMGADRPMLPMRRGLPLVGVLPQLVMDPFGYVVRSWAQKK